jgi:hypothetical protein
MANRIFLIVSFIVLAICARTMYVSDRDACDVKHGVLVRSAGMGYVCVKGV